jgi:hypothetical protein
MISLSLIFFIPDPCTASYSGSKAVASAAQRTTDK